MKTTVQVLLGSAEMRAVLVLLALDQDKLRAACLASRITKLRGWHEATRAGHLTVWFGRADFLVPDTEVNRQRLSELMRRQAEVANRLSSSLHQLGSVQSLRLA
jgi:hypothetical protein